MKKYKIVVSYETTAVFEIEAETEEEATEAVEDAILTYPHEGLISEEITSEFKIVLTSLCRT